jgi:hypothetical protein
VVVLKHQTVRAACFAALLIVAAPAAAQPISPEALYELYEKLATPDVDQERHIDVTGRTFEREDLTLTFNEGVVHPVVRTDGKVVGLVFSGRGEMGFTPPHEAEQQQMTHLLGDGFFASEFTSAWILATDDTVEALLGDAEWATEGGAPNKVKNTHDARFALYNDRLWDDYGPALEMDVLHDLHGAGYLGGYFYGEFNTEPGRWMTYYRNPRLALYPGEEVCFFSHARRGDAPQTMQIYASYPSADPVIDRAAGRPWDMANVELEVTVPKPKGGRDLAQVDFAAQLRIVALTDDVRSVALRLQGRRPRCKGDEAWGEFDISAIRDYAGEPVPAIQDHNQLFVVLRSPMKKGDIETLNLTYGGAVIEAVTVAEQADIYFTALQDFAWYPRPLWPDRHSLETTIHVPRFYKGVATGELMEETENDDMRTMVYQERGGVLGGMLAVGDYVMTEGEEGSTQILVFTSQANKQTARDIVKRTEAMLRYFGHIWGPYPYSTLTLLDLPALPSGNWQSYATESVSMTQEAGWTCSPPGQLYAWEGFTTSDTGCVSFHMPSTAPAVDNMETRNINFYFVDNPEAQAAYTASLVARQWWDQFVGPATYRDRWITEGAVMLSAALLLGQQSGLKAQEVREESWHDMALRREASGNLLVGDRLTHEYPGVMWGKGPAVMRMMLDTLGGEPFINMMRSLMNRAPGGAVTNDLFHQVALEYMGPDADAFWEYWVEGNDIPGLRYAYEIIEEEDGTFRVEGKIVVEGAVPPTPIPIQIKYSAKDTVSETVDLEGPETTFVFDGLEKKPKKVLLDPGHRVLLAYRKPLKE